MPHPLRTDFLLAEESFVSALSEGSGSIQSFDETWSKLQLSLEEAMKLGNIDDDTLGVVHQVASRIQMLAGRFIELQDNVGAVTDSLERDLNVIFDDLSLQEFPKQANRRSNSATPETSLPAYVKPAYGWLMKNLHNPYPSSTRKEAIAKDAGVELKDVENWFISARKRIGWNSLRAKSFSNKRNLIVVAATQWFRPTPASMTCGSHESSLISNHGVDFMAIENRANGLYSGRFCDTAGSVQPGAAIDRCDMSITKHPRKKHRLAPVTKNQHPAASYPSPERSPERSLSPIPASPSPIYQQTMRKSLKRRQSSASLSDSDTDSHYSHPKRPRVDSFGTPATESPGASLPSPATSIFELSVEQPSGSKVIVPADSTPLPGKRKRSSSTSGREEPSKRPHTALCKPRIQTVSDPLPMGSQLASELSLDDWFFHSLAEGDIGDGLPSPISIGLPDDFDTLEVSCHQYDLFSSIPPPQSALLATTEVGNTSASILSSHVGNLGPSISHVLPPQFGMPVLENLMKNDGYGDLFGDFNGVCDFPSATYPRSTDDDSISLLTVPSQPIFDLTWTSLLSDNISGFLDQPSTCTPTIDVFNQPSDALAITKYERVQQLRNELQRLEADLDS